MKMEMAQQMLVNNRIRFAVTNTGNVTLYNIMITDLLPGIKS